jgi:S-adenosylmethionine hydrolase
MFDQCIGDGPFKIDFGLYEIHEISQNYSDVAQGEIVGLFNAEGRLEIAQNKGTAEKVFALKNDTSTIIIEKLRD